MASPTSFHSMLSSPHSTSTSGLLTTSCTTQIRENHGSRKPCSYAVVTTHCHVTYRPGSSCYPTRRAKSALLLLKLVGKASPEWLRRFGPEGMVLYPGHGAHEILAHDVLPGKRMAWLSRFGCTVYQISNTVRHTVAGIPLTPPSLLTHTIHPAFMLHSLVEHRDRKSPPQHSNGGP